MENTINEDPLIPKIVINTRKDRAERIVITEGRKAMQDENQIRIRGEFNMMYQKKWLMVLLRE